MIKTLKTQSEFDRFRKGAQSFTSGPIIFLLQKKEDQHPKFGVVTGKKIGKACKRNLVKRILKHRVHNLEPKEIDFDILAICLRKKWKKEWDQKSIRSCVHKSFDKFENKLKMGIE